MSLSDLNKYSAGLNDDTENQNADTIINIDTGDADETGMPIDTSDAPEADIGEAVEETAVAVESQEVAEDAAETTEDLEQVEEALESLQRERRAPTAMEAKLIDALANTATSRLYGAASREQRLAGVYGSGLNSIAGTDADMVAAGLNEVRKGIVETFKNFIRKVIDFFKGIAKSIGKFISGSKKLQARATEIAKRAGESKSSGTSKPVAVGGSSALFVSGNLSTATISTNLSGLNAIASDVLGGTGFKPTLDALLALLKKGDVEDADTKETYEKIASSGIFRKSSQLIGGLQIGTQVNVENYTVKAFAKQTNPAEIETLPGLSASVAKSFAEKSGELVASVIKYQDGWKAREATQREWEKSANEVAKDASKDYAKSTDDKIHKRIMRKRKIAQSAGQTLMSVVGVETRLVTHCLKVAKVALSYADKALKDLDKEGKAE